MKVFDFDNTIYDGESLFDFFIFVTKKNKKALIYIPSALSILIQYKLKLITEEKANKMTSKFMKIITKNKNKIDEYVEEFWHLNKHKLKKDFLDKLAKGDIIITASPSLIMNKIATELKGVTIIASEFNLVTAKFDFLCYGPNKVKIFEERYGKNKKIKEFYTDSLNDLPMIKKAKKAFMVKKNTIKKIKLTIQVEE